MVILISSALGVSAAFILAITLLLRKLATSGGRLPVMPDWIDDLSVERYRPMLRLLNNDDLAFLRSQPGYTPRLEARLRRQRYQIFAEYLRSLSADFNNVCAALKVLMVQSRHDRPDLAAALLRNQARFAVSLAIVRVRVFLYRFGFGTVDARPLVRIFDGMRLELRTLVPATAHVSA